MQQEITLQRASAVREARLPERLANAKRAFTTRRVDLSKASRIIRSGVAQVPGDLVLARVAGNGQHRRIENIHGRRGDLFIVDEIIVAYPSSGLCKQAERGCEQLRVMPQWHSLDIGW